MIGNISEPANEPTAAHKCGVCLLFCSFPHKLTMRQLPRGGQRSFKGAVHPEMKIWSLSTPPDGKSGEALFVHGNIFWSVTEHKRHFMFCFVFPQLLLHFGELFL